MKYYNLNNGNDIPAIGFGCYKIIDKETLRNTLVNCARNDYELIDTAFYYDNEHLIGEILKEECLEKEFCIATKVWPSDFGIENTKKSVERSLVSLNRDYLDIMYLHWPGDDMEKSWRVLEDYYEQGVIKNIAVSNFFETHLKKLFNCANIPPQINQLEIHPLNQQNSLIEFCKSNDIQVVAWSPLARGNSSLFDNERLVQIASNHKASVAQIILAWHLSRGLAIIPKTISANRLKENIEVLDINLSNDELLFISSLNADFSVSQSPLDENWLRKIRYE
ncbi:MAG: aldo/keto reductase [Tissierellia bacterium]|nr:aldo/keto reductase [Tissierellia bacterium]